MAGLLHLTSADAFADAMDQKGISVRNLADEVGVSKSLIGHYRTGKRTRVRVDVAEKIATALDVDDPTTLFDLPFWAKGRSA